MNNNQSNNLEGLGVNNSQNGNNNQFLNNGSMNNQNVTMSQNTTNIGQNSNEINYNNNVMNQNSSNLNTINNQVNMMNQSNGILPTFSNQVSTNMPNYQNVNTSQMTQQNVMNNGNFNNQMMSNYQQVQVQPPVLENEMTVFFKGYWKYILIGLGIIILLFLIGTFINSLFTDSSLKKNERLLAVCTGETTENGNLESSVVYKVILNNDYSDKYGLKLLQELHFYTQKDITDEQMEKVKEMYNSNYLEVTVSCPDGNQTNTVGCDTKVTKVSNREFVVSGYTYKYLYRLDNFQDMTKDLESSGFTCKNK